MMLEKKIQEVVKEFRKSVTTALAIDWGSLIGIIAEILIPMLAGCGGTDASIAARMKKPNWRDRILTRLAYRKYVKENQDSNTTIFSIKRHVDALVDATHTVAENSDNDELLQVVEEAKAA